MESNGNKVLQEDLEFIANSNINFDKFKNCKILVTGATGLVGSQIVRAFACLNRVRNFNMKIILFVEKISNAKNIYGDFLNRDDIVCIENDIRDSSLINFLDYDVDYIIHTASITNSKTMITYPADVIDISLNGTKNMLDFSIKHNVKGFIYISSMEMYGKLDSECVSEEDCGIVDILDIRSNYPLGKRMCENMCIAYLKQYNVPVYIARLAQTFGAGISSSDNRVFAQFARSVMNNSDIVLHTKGLSEGNYCYLRDTVLGIMTILLKGEVGEAYNVVNESTHTTIADMARMVAKDVAGGKINVVFDIPDDNIYGYAKDTKMKLSSKKLSSLGWRPSVNLKEAYIRMIESLS